MPSFSRWIGGLIAIAIAGMDANGATADRDMATMAITRASQSLSDGLAITIITATIIGTIAANSALEKMGPI